jgi:hypothetical protein
MTGLLLAHETHLPYTLRPEQQTGRKVIMEPVKWSATEALTQLDKVDLQFVKGIINEGDRNGQRLVIMLNLIAWAKMETIINIAEA